MALSTKARKRLEAALSRKAEATEIADAIDSVLDTNVNTALTLNVSVTGSDSGDGSVTKPFRSIQAAIDSLARKVNRNAAIIQVGAGSFNAFSINGGAFTPVSPSTVSTPTQGSLTIAGTWIAPVLTSGTTSGTATGSLVDLAAVLTDAGQSWTVNELRGRFVLVSSIYYPIISNTATTITAASNSALSGAYSIWEVGTVINTGSVMLTSSGSGVARIAISDLITPNSNDITISTMVADSTGLASGNSAVTIRNATVTLANVSLLRTSGTNTAGVSCTSGSTLTLSKCYVSFNDTTGNGITSATALRNFTLFNSYFRNGATAISTGTGPSLYSIGTSTFEGQTTGLSLNAGSQALITSGMRFINTTTAISVGSTNASATLSSASATTMFFNGCTTILSAQNHAICALATCSGSGNTNGIVAVKGARVQISNTATLSVSGNELSVDGTTGTLVTLRGNSPRVFPLVPNPYGTYIYE